MTCKEMTEIVEKNLERMTGHGEGYMRPLVLNESMGGNAGNWQDIPCAAANFYYVLETGEIVYFGNCQRVPDEIKEKLPQGVFRIAVDTKKTGKLRIIGTGLDRITLAAEKTLEASVEEFNKRHGFKIEK